MRYCYKVKIKNKLTGLYGLLFLLILTQSSVLYASSENYFHSCLTNSLQQEPRLLQQDTTTKNKRNKKAKTLPDIKQTRTGRNLQ